MIILQVNPELEKEIGNKKIELSIFCSMEQVYTFIVNYIVDNHDRIK
jgi:hypothetical protein